jgi:hypothetical protein
MTYNKLHAYIVEELSSLHRIMMTQPEMERAGVILDCALHDLKCKHDCRELRKQKNLNGME